MNGTRKDEKTLTVIITEGPYRSQYVEMAHNIVESALKKGYAVNLFLYMDATHIPKKNQNPHSFPNVGYRLRELINKGADVRACVRCATARGHACDKKSYLKGVTITKPDGFAFADTLGLLKWSEEKFGLFAFQTEDEYAAFFGKINRVEKDMLVIDSVFADGKVVPDYDFEFDLKEVRAITFGSDYFESMRLLWVDENR